jgi:hypothetical protein
VCLIPFDGVSRRPGRLGTALHRLSFHHAFRISISLEPFAPPALPGFIATMAPLTPAAPLLRPAGLIASWIKPSDRSVSKHPSSSRSLGLLPRTDMPPDRLLRSRPTHSAGLRWRTEASPSGSRLATTKDRIEFVSYGPVVHLLVLSTPSHEDAVPLGYDGQAGRRQGLSPCGFNPLTIAQPAASRPVGLHGLTSARGCPCPGAGV